MKYNQYSLRHELKYYIPYADYMAMRGRLAAFMRPDENMTMSGGYRVRSLYFDDAAFTNRWEKEAGVEKRSKTRVRVYDKSSRLIRLEKKIKVGQYIGKQSGVLQPREWEQLLRGDPGFMLRKDSDFFHQMFAEFKLRRLRPAVIVDYRREAYVMRAGNVRVTFDHELQAAVGDFNLFSDAGLIHYNAYPPQMLTMEVKFDDFLPGTVRKLVRPYTARRSEISKYVLCLRALQREMQYSKGLVL